MARIRGIGVDIALIHRFSKLVQSAKFLGKALHPDEAARVHELVSKAQQLKAHLASAPAADLAITAQDPLWPAARYVASRWAAKEALHKALQSERLLFPDILVAHLGAV